MNTLPLPSKRSRANRQALIPVGMIIFLIGGIAYLAFLIYVQLTSPIQGAAFLNVETISHNIADYSAEAHPLFFPALRENILQAVLRDLDPDATDIPARVAKIGDELRATIPAATRSPSITITPPAAATSLPAVSTSTETAAATLASTPTLAATSPFPTAYPSLLPGQSTTPSPAISRTVTSQPLTSSTPGTATPGGSLTPTPTQTRTSTSTPTSTRTSTPAFTPTSTPTQTPAYTPTPSFTPTNLPAPTATFTNTPAPTPTPSSTPTPTNTPTSTSTPTPSSTPTPTHTPTPSFTPTDTPTPTATPTLIATPTLAACNSVLTGARIAAADTWVDQTKPTANYGTDTALFIRPTAGIDKRGLVRFDLSDIAPGSTVVSAILYLYDSTGKQTYGVDLLKITSAWDEMTVDWNTQPSFDSTSARGAFTLTKTVCYAATYLDLATIQGWVNDPASNFGLMIYPPSGAGDTAIASRESGASTAPQLWIQVQAP